MKHTCIELGNDGNLMVFQNWKSCSQSTAGMMRQHCQSAWWQVHAWIPPCQNFKYRKPLVWTSPRLPSFVMDSTQQSPMKFCNLIKSIFQGGLAIVRSNVQWSCFLMKSVRFLIKSIFHSFPLPLLVARVRSLYYNHDGAGESWSSFVNNNNNINIKLSVVVWKRSCWTV